MGLFGRWRAARAAREAALAEQKAARAAATAVEEATQALRAAWDALDGARLEAASTSVDGVMLKPREIAYARIEGVQLIEPRREPGRWVGGSQGVSLRLAKGVSYRVGASRGRFQQGDEVPTPIDSGVFVVTDRRCLFVGSKRSTEWAYSKLLGFSLEGRGLALFSVSNRQKTTGVHYGAELEARMDAIVAAAIARSRSDEEHQALLAELAEDHRRCSAEYEAAQAALRPGGGQAVGRS
jgi:hypothetical protein